MLDDIEQLTYGYHKPQKACILLFYWDEHNDVTTDIYELSAIKSAQADRRELIDLYSDGYEMDIRKTKRSRKYIMEYPDGVDVLISLEIKIMND